MLLSSCDYAFAWKEYIHGAINYVLDKSNQQGEVQRIAIFRAVDQICSRMRWTLQKNTLYPICLKMKNVSVASSHSKSRSISI
jgi:hypothetical protein